MKLTLASVSTLWGTIALLVMTSALVQAAPSEEVRYSKPRYIDCRVRGSEKSFQRLIVADPNPRNSEQETQKNTVLVLANLDTGWSIPADVVTIAFQHSSVILPQENCTHYTVYAYVASDQDVLSARITCDAMIEVDLSGENPAKFRPQEWIEKIAKVSPIGRCPLLVTPEALEMLKRRRD